MNSDERDRVDEPRSLSSLTPSRPSREQAEAAVQTLLAWAGDDPSRDGLIDTPARVARAFEEFFQGYGQDPGAILSRTFEDVDQYQDMVLVRGIEFVSHCEHHMVAFRGRAHVAYLPNDRVVGLSKLARLVDAFARRLQVQERLTMQIATAIETHLSPRGVAVMIEAEHQYMSDRGVAKHGADTVTSHTSGEFQRCPDLRREFFDRARGRS